MGVCAHAHQKLEEELPSVHMWERWKLHRAAEIPVSGTQHACAYQKPEPQLPGSCMHVSELVFWFPALLRA